MAPEPLGVQAVQAALIRVTAAVMVVMAVHQTVVMDPDQRAAAALADIRVMAV